MNQIKEVRTFCRYLTWLAIILPLQHASGESFKVERLSDNVYVFIPPRPWSDVVHGNCTIVIGTETVLVVDTFGDHLLAEEAIVQIRRLTDKPVRYIINTHWHYDHLGGNNTFKREFPGAVIICHQHAKKYLTQFVLPNFDREPQASRELIDEYSKAIKSGMKDDSSRLTSYEQHVRYPETIADLKNFVSNFSKTKYQYQPPDIWLERDLQINLGSDTVYVSHYGWGHSPDDLIIHLPRQKILITGDIVVGPIPYAFNTIENDWSLILNKIMERPDVQIIVPGHGDIQRDKEFVLKIAKLLSTTDQKIKECLEKGLSQLETLERIQLNDYRSLFAGDDPALQWAFDNYFLKPRIKNYFKEKSQLPRVGK